MIANEELRSALKATENNARRALERTGKRPWAKVIKKIAEIAGAFTVVIAFGWMMGTAVATNGQRNAEAEFLSHSIGE